ncbi:hypothetical protein [Proteiniborus sp.]|uniref:hypothetical protein n=1 Tax=Proteiniborus sp. TaxID=2079015 RepID=UPI00331E3969
MKNYKRWTEEEVQYLKINWSKKRIQEIADSLGRTYDSIYMKARALYLGPNKNEDNRNWSEDDLEYLMDNWGYLSIPALAKNLNRSANAVELKSRKLKLGPFLEAGEYITLNQLRIELRGTNSGGTYTVNQWINKGIPVKTRKVKNCSFRIIYLQDFWDWAEMNSTLIDFSKLEPLALGKEPKWLENQRRADIEKQRQFKTSP